MSAIADLLQKLLDAAKGIPGLMRDRKRKRILQSMLNDPTYEWRKLSTLARAVGASEEKTRELLISIGARGSAASDADELWGLTTRVGTAGTRSDA